MDSEIITALCEQNICNIIFRPHPNLFRPEKCDGFDWHAEIESLSKGTENFVIYSGKGTSLYDILGCVDFLVSDISSALYEFLVFNKPAILYVKKNVGSYYDCSKYLELTKKCCHILTCAEDFCSVLTDCASSPGLFSKQREKLLRESLYFPGKSVEAMLNVFQLLKEHKV